MGTHIPSLRVIPNLWWNHGSCFETKLWSNWKIDKFVLDEDFFFLGLFGYTPRSANTLAIIGLLGPHPTKLSWSFITPVYHLSSWGHCYSFVGVIKFFNPGIFFFFIKIENFGFVIFRPPLICDFSFKFISQHFGVTSNNYLSIWIRGL